MSDANGRTTLPTSLWLDTETRDVLERLATETGMSRSAVAREAIRLMGKDPRQSTIRRLVKELSKAVGT